MRKIIFLLLYLLAALSLLPFAAINASEVALEITAVLPNPIGEDSKFEWVELYNPSGAAIDISQYKLSTGASSVRITAETYTLEPKRFLYLIGDPSAPENTAINLTLLKIPLALSNKETKLSLIKEEVTVSELIYKEVGEGKITKFIEKCAATRVLNRPNFTFNSLYLDYNCSGSEEVPIDPPVEETDTYIAKPDANLEAIRQKAILKKQIDKQYIDLTANLKLIFNDSAEVDTPQKATFWQPTMVLTGKNLTWKVLFLFINAYLASWVIIFGYQRWWQEHLSHLQIKLQRGYSSLRSIFAGKSSARAGPR